METPVSEVLQLRQQGLTDNLILEELKNRGYQTNQINMALSQADMNVNNQGMPNYPPMEEPTYPPQTSARTNGSEETNIYERIEEIAGGIIDEKWDELLGEVKKIIEWKSKVEEKQLRLESEVNKLKEDFKTLHGGVLGKLEDYDTQMREVGTELKAVGKVFKDVIPEFVENVKELRHLTKEQKEE